MLTLEKVPCSLVKEWEKKVLLVGKVGKLMKQSGYLYEALCSLISIRLDASVRRRVGKR